MDAVISYTITGVVEVAKLVASSISFLVSGSYDQDITSVVLKVDSMDLHTKMRLLERLIKEYPSNYELVFGLDKTLKTLHDNLDKIQAEINNHKDKWFRRYRKIDVANLLLELDRDNTIITERLRYLMFTSEVQRLQKEHPQEPNRDQMPLMDH
jgi:hypothetical protein